MYKIITKEDGELELIPMELSEFIEVYGWDYDSAQWWEENQIVSEG